MKSQRRFSTVRLQGLDLARRTRIRRHLDRLLESQWYSRDQLQAEQLVSIVDLLRFAGEKVPFYRTYLREAGLDPARWTSLDDLADLPVVTKSQLRRDKAQFAPEPESRGRTLVRHTGGSTGDPLVYQVSVEAFSIQWASVFRAWNWSGYTLGDQMVTLGGGSVASAGGRSVAHRIYDFLRCNRSLAAATLDKAVLARFVSEIQRYRPRLIYGYPSVLYQLARHMEDNGDDLSGVRSVITTSEMLFPRQRELLARVFAAPVFDFYGCNEANLITGECEYHDGYHIAMESAHVEILDVSDQPVRPGEVGRIIVTGLNNRGLLFVRYDTGDMGSLTEAPCRCGRGLVRLQGIAGRSRDFVKTPDGKLIHGVAFNEVLLQFSWVDRYQLIQLDAKQATLNLATSGAVGTSELDALRQAVAGLCGLEITLVLNQAFEITVGQKNRVIICRLQEADDA